MPNNNETRLHRAARRLQRASELNYTKARAVLDTNRPWPDFNDPDAVAAFIATAQQAPAPVTPVADVGPRVIARFIPQAWADDNAIDVDGSYTFDVTDIIDEMGRDAALTIADHSNGADELWYRHPVSTERPWHGPFEIEVVDSIAAHYDVTSDSTSVWDLLANARVRFWTCPQDHPREPLRTTVTWDGDVATCADCGRTSEDSTADEGALRRHLRSHHSVDAFDPAATEESLGDFHYWDHETGIVGPDHDPGDLSF